MVDAASGFAQPAFSRGLPVALKMAEDFGICALAIHRSHTCTSLGFFTEQIALNGLIAVGFTNASAVVSPPGGNTPVVGTNPIAMAVPNLDGELAFQFDQCTTQTNITNIINAVESGAKIPIGWALDHLGQPTTDPAQALSGSLLPIGGYRGFGFGIMAEVLSAIVTGSSMSIDTNSLKNAAGKPHNVGQFYFLMDPEVFAGHLFWSQLNRLTGAVEIQPNSRLPGLKFSTDEFVSIELNLWQSIIELAMTEIKK
jgi:(2R)-3-sulfolactate dehydrogenase (NADP+)